MHWSQTLRHRLARCRRVVHGRAAEPSGLPGHLLATDLVTDREALARIDGAVARAAVGRGAAL